ncbi:acetylcholinesterase-like [Haemaphysalis longicornis]
MWSIRPLLVLPVLAAVAGGAYDVVKRTRQGYVGGNKLLVLGVEVEEFRGIPFAQPPVGPLRFLPPRPASPWEGTLNATSRKTACPQELITGALKDVIEFTEDCLHLNVWTPVSREEETPVLVWIYGGGFKYGSASYDLYTGAVMAANTGLVVVSVNYRLGALGFLNAYSPQSPGNMGLLDQNLALVWVQENIHQFGGDRSRVTIFGESAGGMSVHAHVLSPSSRGLFKRAVMMSGNLLTRLYLDSVPESIIKGVALASALGCGSDNKTLISHPKEVIECLRSKSAEDILLATSETLSARELRFLPTFGDRFLPMEPKVAAVNGLFDPVDLLVGVTEDEGAIALMLPLRKELMSDNLGHLGGRALQRSLHTAFSPWLENGPQGMLSEYTTHARDGPSLRRQYVDYISDSVFVCPMHFAAERHSKRGQSIYSYVFGHRPTVNLFGQRDQPLPSWMRTPHSFDLMYLFGAPLVDQETFDAEDASVSSMLLRILATFATTGVPELPGNQLWPKYSAECPISAYLCGGNVTDLVYFRTQHCDAWRRYL